MPAMEHTLSLPERYRATRRIAAGGMATVYACEDQVLGRLVAVKVLAPHYAADSDAAARFQREARAAARVSDHPHVVTIYDIGEHEGAAFIVMEYFPGGTVADRLRSGEPIPRPTAVRWLDEAASAMSPSASSSAWTMSQAVRQRWSGSFSMPRQTTRSTLRGRSAASSLGRGGGVSTCARACAAGCSATNGRRPVSSS